MLKGMPQQCFHYLTLASACIGKCNIRWLSITSVANRNISEVQTTTEPCHASHGSF
jgi:hypothetical protein